MVRPGRQPTWPSTDCAGIEYFARLFSNQSAQRVMTERLWSRIRWAVVTPPMSGSTNGLSSSGRVPSVQRVSESSSTITSPRASCTPRRTAFRLPATGVQVQSTSGNAAHTPSSASLRGPFTTTRISSGRCATTRESTSRNRSSGSSTTGITTVVVIRYGAVQGV